VFNINNSQDLNNMVWMNNSNSGLPISSGQNSMIINNIDENSITYFNTQQAGSANLAQQQAALMVIKINLLSFSMALNKSILGSESAIARSKFH
jgi:hypothetical protein